MNFKKLTFFVLAMPVLVLAGDPYSTGDFESDGNWQGYGTYWNHREDSSGNTVLVGAWIDSVGTVRAAYEFNSSTGESTGAISGGGESFNDWHQDTFGYSAGGSGSGCNTFIVCDPVRYMQK